MSDQPADLNGLRVLVVEDEFLVSMLLEEMLADLGCSVVGPYATLPAALEGARTASYDVAVIDLNLGGEKSDPVIAEVAGRSIPHAIASGGYDAASGHKPTVLLDKPYSSAQLEQAMRTLRGALDQKV
jgi:CheY-like chemotaxis protein